MTTCWQYPRIEPHSIGFSLWHSETFITFWLSDGMILQLEVMQWSDGRWVIECTLVAMGRWYDRFSLVHSGSTHDARERATLLIAEILIDVYELSVSYYGESESLSMRDNVYIGGGGLPHVAQNGRYPDNDIPF